jgi:hypothetical protein
VQPEVARRQKVELVVEVAVHGGRAGPYSLAAEQGGRESEKPPAPAPQGHDAARSRPPRRHRVAEGGAVPLLVLAHLRERRDLDRVEPPRDRDLGGVDADRARIRRRG